MVASTMPTVLAIVGIFLIPKCSASSLRGVGGINAAKPKNLTALPALSDRRALANGLTAFAPLSCNTGFGPCVDWDSMDFDLSNKVVIPCGVCVIVGCATETLDTPNGIDVQGRLVFQDYQIDCPSSSSVLPRVTVTTPFLHVQGELELRSSRKTSADPDVKILLTGDANASLTPHTENSNLCDATNGCNMGKKSVVVAGGRLDIQGLPQGCNTWTKIKDTATAVDPPSFELEAVPVQPGGCSATSLVAYDWDDQLPGAWNSHYSPGGFNASEQFFIALGRSADWQGPMLTMNSLMDCVLPDVTYYVSVKVRLSTADGSVSKCQAEGSSCVNGVLYSEDTDPSGGPNKENWDVKLWGFSSGYGPDGNVTDGEWFDMFSEMTFSEEEASTTNMVHRRLFFDGPEAGVDIALDDFSISLLPPNQFSFEATDKPCQNLIPFNRDASDSIGDYYYPFSKTDGKLQVKEELLSNGDANKYFALSDRGHYWSNMGYELETGCIKEGFTYTFSMKIRVQSTTPTGVRLFRYREENGAKKAWKTMKECGQLSIADGWVTCSVAWTFDKDDDSATQFKFYTETEKESSTHPDLDYDDISVEFTAGPVTSLVIESDGIDSCWGSGSELLITSHTLNWQDSSTVVLDRVTDLGSGSYALELLPPYLSAETTFAAASDSPYNSEVALLSRNLLMEGADDDSVNPLHGGHLMIFETPNVAQLIEGLEVRKFGQQELLGKYPIHFHMSDSVVGSVVSKNLVRESFQRCFVLHGSHNITVSQNVAYDTQGHCYMLEDGGEMDNTFEYNLGALTKPAERIRDEESDDTPSTFWITNPVNTIRGNVAAGSSSSGFWFEMRTSVRSPSGSTQKFDPSRLPLRLFSDNTAHSNFEHGVKTYPGKGYNPPSQGLATFQNTMSFRNRGAGIRFHNSRNIHVQGGLLADNLLQLDVDRAPGCSLDGATVVGFSPEYTNIVNSTMAWSRCSNDNLVGVQMHTHWGGGAYNLGTNVTNTKFENFDDAECPGSVAVEVDYYEDKGYFDVRSKISGLTFDTSVSSSHVSLCNAQAAGIDHIAIHDDDGSVMGSPGFIVSDSPRMTTFLPDSACTRPADTCSAFCPGVCYRTWAAAVPNYSPDALELKVTDSAGRSIAVRGTYEYPIDFQTMTDDEDEHVKVWRSRRFFLQLPDDRVYTAKFVLNGEDYWPLYVQQQFEDEPGACSSTTPTVDLAVPGGEQCDQLIKNGDMDLGIQDWWALDGGLVTVDQSSSGQGNALTNKWRKDTWYGLAQYLDARCLEEGTEYTITAKVKMYNADGVTPFSCGTLDDCKTPRAGLKASKGTASDKYDESWKLVGGAQGQWQEGEWNEIAGDFTVSATQATAQSVYLYLDGPPKNIIVVWDDVSVTPKAAAPSDSCNDNGLILNDTFDGGSYMGWNSHYSEGGYEVIEEDSHSVGDSYFLAKGRIETWQGPMKEISVDCLNPNKSYSITAKIRLTTEDGTPSNCQANVGTTTAESSHSFCPKLMLYTEDTNPSGGPAIKSWITLGRTYPHNDGEWIEFNEVAVFSEAVVNSTSLVVRRLYVEGPEPGVDIAMDDMKIEATTCNDNGGALMNYAFDSGTYQGWNSQWSPGGYLVTAQNSHTANNTYFMAVGRSANWQGPMVTLPVECLVVGASYSITAKVRISRSDGLTSSCQESGTGCVSLTLYSEDDDGSKHWANKGRDDSQHQDGDWFIFSSTASFTQDEADRPVRRFYFSGPEADVDIAIDDVLVTLAGATP